MFFLLRDLLLPPGVLLWCIYLQSESRGELKLVEKITALVIGAGQAGVAMSEHLSKNGISHLVLERSRIAERWRTSRWDSLVANGPAWHDRFPGMEFPGFSADAFLPKDKVADYFEAYAKMIEAPIRCGVAVTEVRRNIAGRPGFVAETAEGPIEAEYVVVATGAFQSPVMPALVPETAGVMQIHSDSYRNPRQLPAGAVLVVGSGSSGVQIADELVRAGRRVYLSVGRHDRPPRRYRGRDFVWWLGVLNKWDAEAPPTTEHVTIAVSGAHGGRTIDFRGLAERGMTLLGRTAAFHDGVLNISADLAETIAKGDKNYLAVLDEADAYIARNGLDLPEEPEARLIPADPECVTHPILELDTQAAGITAIIWATGFAADYDWLKLDTFTKTGAPKHQRGVAAEPGLYFLGLPWQSRRGSSFIWGVWHDAKFLADHIAKQRGYLAYKGSAQPAA
jgi:putative flavoprotein involved in K+ transport